jgi:hypothetical protein
LSIGWFSLRSFFLVRGLLELKTMQKKNYCFHARVGTDRYRVALLPLYPQLLHLEEIVKRIAVMYREPDVTTDNSVAVADAAAVSAKQRALLANIQGRFELAWQVTLEAAGVLANSFAPYPTENCNDDASRDYQRLWSQVDAEFFGTTVGALARAFADSLTLLQSVAQCKRNEAQEEAVEKESAEIPQQHSSQVKQLCRETWSIEANDTRLKNTSIGTMTLQVDDEEPTELTFPFSSSRLLR